MTEFGKRLDAILKKKNMSDSALAKRIKVAQPAIHTLKNKTANPRIGTVKKIAKALRVKPAALMAESKETPVEVWLLIKAKSGEQRVRVG